jgi:hypothetical protein
LKVGARAHLRRLISREKKILVCFTFLLARVVLGFWSSNGTGERMAKSGVGMITDIWAGAKGVEYPTRFFARDYAGNRLEFSL